MGVGAHRQGQGQVALLGQEAAVEPHDGQREHAEGHGEDAQEEQDHHAHAQAAEDPVDIVGGQEEVVGEIGDGGHRQQGQEHRQHDAGGGPEFVFQRFAQHLNTSLNRASTDVPFSLRMASTLEWRAIRPFCRKMTSSSTCSTSAIRWVEMMMEAFSL